MAVNLSPVSPVKTRTKLWRAATSAAPLVGAAAVGVAAYKFSPDFQQAADAVRAQLNRSPRVFEVASSGVTLGAIPDLLAQRYEGGRFNWRRFAGMTVLGSLIGGYYSRGLYDAQEHLFPGSGTGVTVKKILFDQFTASPVYMFLYLLTVKAINTADLMKKSVHNLCGAVRIIAEKGFLKGPIKILANIKSGLTDVRKKYDDLLPKNCLYWGGVALPIIYNLPQDLKVYVAQFFALFWFTFSSKVSNASASSEPATWVGRLLNKPVSEVYYSLRLFVTSQLAKIPS